MDKVFVTFVRGLQRVVDQKRGERPSQRAALISPQPPRLHAPDDRDIGPVHALALRVHCVCMWQRIRLGMNIEQHWIHDGYD